MVKYWSTGKVIKVCSGLVWKCCRRSFNHVLGQMKFFKFDLLRDGATAMLVQAECVRCPWAASRNVCGHYKWHFFSFSLLSGSLLILPEGVVVGFRNLAWAPNSQKY